MSTGAECNFYESEKGWHYRIQRWPYGESEEFDRHGPFGSFEQAKAHLNNNYANPGGYSVSKKEDSK